MHPQSVVRRGQSDYDRAHLRMNIAEDERDARLVEFHKAGGSTLIEPQIKSLSIEQREHVMKEGVAIGKLNLAARWNHDQRRMECLVPLHQLRNVGRFLLGWTDSVPNRGQPNDCLGSIFQAVATAYQIHMSTQGLLRVGAECGQQEDAEHYAFD